MNLEVYQKATQLQNEMDEGQLKSMKTFLEKGAVAYPSTLGQFEKAAQRIWGLLEEDEKKQALAARAQVLQKEGRRAWDQFANHVRGRLGL